MVKKIRDVLLELGKGFSFIGNQYKISMSKLPTEEDINLHIDIKDEDGEIDD